MGEHCIKGDDHDVGGHCIKEDDHDAGGHCIKEDDHDVGGHCIKEDDHDVGDRSVMMGYIMKEYKNHTMLWVVTTANGYKEYTQS